MNCSDCGYDRFVEVEGSDTCKFCGLCVRGSIVFGDLAQANVDKDTGERDDYRVQHELSRGPLQTAVIEKFKRARTREKTILTAFEDLDVRRAIEDLHITPVDESIAVQMYNDVSATFRKNGDNRKTVIACCIYHACRKGRLLGDILRRMEIVGTHDASINNRVVVLLKDKWSGYVDVDNTLNSNNARIIAMVKDVVDIKFVDQQHVIAQVKKIVSKCQDDDVIGNYNPDGFIFVAIVVVCESLSLKRENGQDVAKKDVFDSLKMTNNYVLPNNKKYDDIIKKVNQVL